MLALGDVQRKISCYYINKWIDDVLSTARMEL